MRDIRCNIACIIRTVAEMTFNGKKQVLLHHPFDDIIRRAYQVKILLPAGYFRQHDFIDVENLVNDTEILSGLLLIPHLEIFQHTFINVIPPIVYFERGQAFIGMKMARHKAQQDKHGEGPKAEKALIFHGQRISLLSG